MLNENEILVKIERWSAQFSPFNPIELEDKDSEMKELAAEMDEHDLSTLLDVMYRLNNEQLDTFMEFAFYYVNQNAETISKSLIEKLQPTGPNLNIDLISYTQQSNLYNDLINRIDYSQLDFESKLSLIDSLDMLNNKNAIAYLSELKNIETNSELLDEIDLVIRNLKN